MKYNGLFDFLYKRTLEVGSKVNDGILGLVLYLLVMVIMLIISFVEIAFAGFICFVVPYLTLSENRTLGIVSLVLAALFALFYHRSKDGYDFFWRFLWNGVGSKLLNTSVFLAFIIISFVLVLVNNYIE